MATTTSTASTASTASSLITALGGGSGIDMAALAENLATAQYATRKDNLTTKSEKLTTQISTASNIKSMLLSLDSSMATLVRSGDLARTPSVADSAVASGSLTGASAPTGSYSLEVTQLASKQTLASAAFSATTSTVGSGTLTLKFGTVSGSTFTQDTAHAAVDITIESGDTLSDVASAINAANAGVSAYVTQTDQGAQLVLKGAEGAANGFILEAAEDSADPGLSALAWTPSSTTGSLISTAKDAKFSVDGLAKTSSSNTITDAIPGVKLQLTGTNSGSPTTVTFADPTSSVASTMQDLVDALNEIMTELNTATAVGGDLASDSGARSLKRALMSMGSQTVMPNATGVAKTLADLGLKTQRDGTFALDTSRLEATIAADPEGVADMFTNGIYGVYATVDKIYRNATTSTDVNSLGSSITRYNKQLTQVTEDQSTLDDDQETLRQRLYSQFSASETRISTFNSTKSMLENQIAQWNKSDS